VSGGLGDIHFGPLIQYVLDEVLITSLFNVIVYASVYVILRLKSGGAGGWNS
jgi:hypothetical protein